MLIKAVDDGTFSQLKFVDVLLIEIMAVSNLSNYIIQSDSCCVFLIRNNGCLRVRFRDCKIASINHIFDCLRLRIGFAHKQVGSEIIPRWRPITNLSGDILLGQRVRYEEAFCIKIWYIFWAQMGFACKQIREHFFYHLKLSPEG